VDEHRPIRPCVDHRLLCELVAGVHLLSSAPPVQLIVGTCAGLLSGALFIAISARARVVVWNVLDVLRQLPGFRRVLYGT